MTGSDPADRVQATFRRIAGIAIDAHGNPYVLDLGHPADTAQIVEIGPGGQTSRVDTRVALAPNGTWPRNLRGARTTFDTVRNKLLLSAFGAVFAVEPFPIRSRILSRARHLHVVASRHRRVSRPVHAVEGSLFPSFRDWMGNMNVVLSMMALLVATGFTSSAIAQYTAQKRAELDRLHEILQERSRVFDEIRSVVGDATCSTPVQCSAVAIGRSRCGGPGVYVPFSYVGTDVDRLWQLSERHRVLSYRYAELTPGAGADVCMTVRPKAMMCEQGRCRECGGAHPEDVPGCVDGRRPDYVGPPRRVELRVPRSVASEASRLDQLVDEVRSDLAPFLRLMRVESEGTIVMNVELPISHEELSSVVERLARHPLVEQATMRCMVEPKAPHGFPVPPTCERDR